MTFCLRDKIQEEYTTIKAHCYINSYSVEGLYSDVAAFELKKILEIETSSKLVEFPCYSRKAQLSFQHYKKECVKSVLSLQ